MAGNGLILASALTAYIAVLCVLDAPVAQAQAGLLCGGHPAGKIAGMVKARKPHMSAALLDAYVAELLVTAPKLRSVYERSLRQYHNCVLMADAGHFGRRR